MKQVLLFIFIVLLQFAEVKIFNDEQTRIDLLYNYSQSQARSYITFPCVKMSCQDMS